MKAMYDVLHSGYLSSIDLQVLFFLNFWGSSLALGIFFSHICATQLNTKENSDFSDVALYYPMNSSYSGFFLGLPASYSQLKMIAGLFLSYPLSFAAAWKCPPESNLRQL